MTLLPEGVRVCRGLPSGGLPWGIISGRVIVIIIITAIGLSPGDSGYFTCKQNMKLVTNKFKSGGLHEKHVLATGNVGNRLSVCL